MSTDGSAQLSFLLSVEYKRIELYKCKLEQADEESVRAQVGFKFKLAHFQMTSAHARLHDMAHIIKQKNPSLLTQIQNGANAATMNARSNY